MDIGMLKRLWPFHRPDAEAEPGAAPVASGRPLVAASGKDVWREILEGFPEAALVIDRDGLVLAANAAAHDLLPGSIGRSVYQLMRWPEMMGAIKRAGENMMPETCHLRLVTPVERHIDGHVTPLSSASEAAWPAMLIVLSDATDEHQLAKLRADFVANASHELRTPLASLKGFIETLQGAAKDDPAARTKFLGIMQEQAARMSRLIDDLLSLSLIEMREHVAPSGTADLNSIAQSAVHALGPVAKGAEIELVLASPKGSPAVAGDRDELAQVVQNLIQNAIKYGRRGGKVWITIAEENSRVALAVRDDGIGISSEHLPRLTERFYRVSAKDSRERGGTGLGLAIVKHIVNRHQGDLKVTSVPGEGSTFTVWLPKAG